MLQCQSSKLLSAVGCIAVVTALGAPPPGSDGKIGGSNDLVPFPDKNVINTPWSKQPQKWENNPDFDALSSQGGGGAWNHAYWEYGYDPYKNGEPYRKMTYPCPKDSKGTALPFLNVSTIAGEGTIAGERRILLPLPEELWPYERYTTMKRSTARIDGCNETNQTNSSDANASNVTISCTYEVETERQTFGSVHFQPGKTNEETHWIKAMRERRAGIGGLVDLKGRTLEIELWEPTSFMHANADIVVLCGAKKDYSRQKHKWSQGGKVKCNSDYGDGKKCD